MFLIIDFLNLAYRSFFAIRQLSTSEGQPTNAVYGFIQSVRKWLEEFKPSHLAIVLDGETPKHRLDLLPTYKANRPPTPEALRSQLTILSQMCPLFGWATAFDPLQEADDLGATIALAAARQGHQVRIASNDKDFLQILGPSVKLLRSTPKKSELVDEAWLQEKWKILPDQVVDFFSLVGDSVDNIPGVPSVGEKTAADLLHQFGSVQNLQQKVEQVNRPKLREALQEHAEQLHRNQQLIRLDTNMVPPPLETFCLQPPKYKALLSELSKLEFKTLYLRYEKERQKTGNAYQTSLF